MTGIRPGLTRTSTELRTLAGNINENRGELDRALGVLPIKLEKVGRTAIYGSWFNFYLCEFQGTVTAARRQHRADPLRAPTRRGATSDEHPIP